MMVLIGPLMLAAVFATVFVALAITQRVQDTRDEAGARQIALTDAIHRELGAVVAPSVVARPWGGWRVLIPVPFTRPDLVASVLRIAHDTVRRLDPRAADHVQIVLTAQH
jgi:hypothetical protein